MSTRYFGQLTYAISANQAGLSAFRVLCFSKRLGNPGKNQMNACDSRQREGKKLRAKIISMVEQPLLN
jgi:hypothetical protein